MKTPTIRAQLREITGKLSKKKQEEIEEFLSFALGNSRIMLLEDLYKEGFITESVGVRYIGREVDFMSATKNRSKD